MLSPTSCPPGYTLRKAHMRKPRGRHTVRRHGRLQFVSSSDAPVRISASCIKTRKRVDKPVAATSDILRKEPLIQYGYQWRMPDAKRRAALQRAIKVLGVAVVYQKLVGITALMKRHASKSRKIRDMYIRFKMDREWMHTQASL